MRARSALLGFAYFFQIAAAAVIAAVTATKLQHIEWRGVSADTLHEFTQEANCLLGPSIKSTSLCTYTYVAVGISLIVTLVLIALGGVMCSYVACGGVAEAVFAGITCVWWAVAGGVLTTNALKANRDGWPQRQWRTAVFAGAWIATVAFGLVALVRMCTPATGRIGREPDVGSASAQRASAKASKRTLEAQRTAYSQFQTSNNPYRSFQAADSMA